MMKLEHSSTELTTRILDIIAPMGFGQRGLIVAPPRTGKTILMQNIAKGVHANYPKVQLVLLLVDERPEEVTDMRRNCPGTVYASSNDNTVEKHLDLAQLVIERCKRQVEFGADIVVLMDSLTRVGRAFNTGGIQGGRTLSGGLDNRALEIPKRLFGAARKIEHGGSLTIIATCLVDTGSRMDQVIFEEFKGTGQPGNHPRPRPVQPTNLPGHQHHRIRHAQGREATERAPAPGRPQSPPPSAEHAPRPGDEDAAGLCWGSTRPMRGCSMR